MFDKVQGVDEYQLENLRRSIAMLTPGQDSYIKRERAMSLIEEVQRLQAEHKAVMTQLRALLAQMGG
jgi:hypothetical protein